MKLSECLCTHEGGSTDYPVDRAQMKNKQFKKQQPLSVSMYLPFCDRLTTSGMYINCREIDEGRLLVCKRELQMG